MHTVVRPGDLGVQPSLPCPFSEALWLCIRSSECADVVSASLLCCCAGAYAADLMSEEERFDVVKNACPGPGACGGMYTANTMASAIEALGMSLPYSSSTPAEDPLKRLECRKAGL